MSIGSEEFEAWARSKSLDLAYRNFPDVGKYYECPRTLLALETWEASRESLVIELPERMPPFAGKSDYWDGAHNGYNQCLDTCKVHFEFAGLKVKP